MDRGARIKGKGVFITGTDTDVGKTVATIALGLALRGKGLKVGAFKPVQCGGRDAHVLKKELGLKEDVKTINPCYAKDPLSPHLAFARAGKKVNIKKIKQVYNRMAQENDLVLVEGAGGLMVPIKKGYFVCDLIRDLNLDVIIVSRLTLGTINHTVLTVEQARNVGLNVRGVIFNEAVKQKKRILKKTNIEAVRKFASVEVIGTVPHLKKITASTILKRAELNTGLIWPAEDRNTATKRLVADDRQYVWHPFTQMKDWNEEDPLVIDEARDSYLIDSEGRGYLDGVSSLWVNVHGHRKKAIDDAVKEQLGKLEHSTLLGLANTPAIELAKRLIAVAPEGLDKVFYSDSGSTAVEIAIKMAYQYWQNKGKTDKKKLIHLAHSYHGDTLGSVSVGGIELFHKVYRDLVVPTVKLDLGDCYRAPAGEQYPDYAFQVLDRFEEYLKKEHEHIAALIVEPIVQGAAGMIVWPDGVLKRMSELCRRYDVFLIADEVATGFGRTGRMFACELEGVTPDIMCLAKGLTGGYLPLAATLTTNRIYDGFLFDYKEQKTFFHGHTYTGNPLCCRAALANLEVFRKEKVLDRLQAKIEHLTKGLKMFDNLALVGDIRQKGFMVGIELVKDKKTKEPFAWEERVGVDVCHRLRKKGVILRPLGNVIVLMPPLSMQKHELDYMLDALYWTIDDVSKNLGQSNATAVR